MKKGKAPTVFEIGNIDDGAEVCKRFLDFFSFPPFPQLCFRQRRTGCVTFKKSEYSRRDGRVAEGARLESVYTRKGIQGSNPCLSARTPSKGIQRSPERLKIALKTNNLLSFLFQTDTMQARAYRGTSGGSVFFSWGYFYFSHISRRKTWHSPTSRFERPNRKKNRTA